LKHDLWVFFFRIKFSKDLEFHAKIALKQPTEEHPMDQHWSENNIEVNGITLHYTRTGKGNNPPLVLIHGFTDNGLCWTPVARELEDSFDVIMPDMRGHGLSSRAKEGDQVDMASDVKQLIEKLELKRPVVGGHSMGSMVTFDLGIRFPDLARALFFEDPLWWVESPLKKADEEPGGDDSIVAWARTLPDTPLDEMIEGYTRDNPTWSEELIYIMCTAKKQLDMGIVDILAKNMQDLAHDWQKGLKQFSQPFMLFSGEPEKGGIVSPQTTELVKEIRPDAKTLMVKGTGHLIRFDGFPEFIKGLKEFLSSLPE